MNTDKLMELERKWRAKVDVDPPSEYDTGWNECTVKRADELAAALRAEQAVGDEQRAREMLAQEYERDGSTAFAQGLREAGEIRDKDCVRALRAIRRALGTARQSEGVGKVFGMEVVHNPKLPPDSFVLVPRKAIEREIAALESPVGCYTGAVAKGLRALLAAAPGGEGEGKV